jgi:hypothetical protein
MKDDIIKKASCGFLFFAFLVTGCTHMIKTDMDTYLKNQEEYKRKKIVFTTDLEDLVERYALYQGREVELTAPITYLGKEDFSTWYIILERDEKQIRAYEDNYRNYINRDALQLLTWAKSEGGEVTVRGKLKEMGIELTKLTYNEYVVHTNNRPYRYRSCCRPYYRSYDGYYGSWTNWNYSHSYNY